MFNARACLTMLALIAVQLFLLSSAETRLASVWQPGRHLLCACPRIYQPVCGSDGKQYPNSCTAECAGVFVTERNPQSALQCSRIAVDPVGPSGLGPAPIGIAQQPVPTVVPTNGDSSGSLLGLLRPNPTNTAARGWGGGSRPLNMNTMNAMNALNTGASGPGCRCPRILLPVCGSDGKLYSNKCLLECAGATATDSRNCPSSSGGCRLLASTAVNQPGCACPRIYSPVCGSNGRQYNNECLAKCEGVSVTGNGANCQPSQQISSGPSQQFVPNSGPSQQFVPNSGLSQQFVPNSGPSQQFGPNPGPNPGPISGPNSGSSQSQPVVTQQNGLGPAGLAVVVDLLSGPANPRQPSGGLGLSCGCELVYAPVCGKDAKWYPNACSAQCAGVALSSVRPDVYGNCLMV